VTPRPYHFVLVSDHGQSQGATFRQRYGLTLEQLVRQHLSAGASVAAATDEVEAYGPVNVLIGQLAGQESVTARLTRRALGDRDVANATGPSGRASGKAAIKRPGGPAKGADTGPGASPDTGFDAGLDAGSDAGLDAGLDASPDMGFEAGSDAEADRSVDGLTQTVAEPGVGAVPAEGEAPVETPDLVVVGSGNLGGIWFAREPKRLLLAEIEERHPGLLTALAGHEGVAFIVVMAPTGPVAIGSDGSIDLATGLVRDTDPLAHFDADARRDFERVALFDDAPDIYVNSLYDPVLDEVAAFEELVGCHGGVGGWQTRPLLVHPKEWPIDPDLVGPDGHIRGADQVHVQLVRWLERLGHRTDLPTTGAVVDPLSEPDGIPQR
jgi:hypothetical protein